MITSWNCVECGKECKDQMKEACFTYGPATRGMHLTGKGVCVECMRRALAKYGAWNLVWMKTYDRPK